MRVRVYQMIMINESRISFKVYMYACNDFSIQTLIGLIKKKLNREAMK